METLKTVADLSTESANIKTSLSEYVRLPENLAKAVQHLMVRIGTLEDFGSFDADLLSRLLQLALRLAPKSLVTTLSVLQQHLSLCQAWVALHKTLEKRQGGQETVSKEWLQGVEKQYVVLAAQLEGCKEASKDCPKHMGRA